MRNRWWMGLVLVGMACGGANPTSPDAPVLTGLTEYTTAPQFAVMWWPVVEGCSGLTGDVGTVHWYHVASITKDGKSYWGYWFRDGNKIVLQDNFLGNAKLIKHEILHALLQRGDHPKEYFVDKCDVAFDGG